MKNVFCSGIEISDVLPCFRRFSVSVFQGCTHVLGHISFLGAGADEFRKATVGFMSVRRAVHIEQHNFYGNDFREILYRVIEKDGRNLKPL